VIDKRKVPRIQISMAIAFSRNGEFLCGDIMNICCNGVFIVTETVLPVDTELALRIRLPGDFAIMDIAGRVAWVNQASAASPAGLGIEFVSMSAEVMIRIEHFVNKRRHDLNSPSDLNRFIETIY